MNKSSNPGLAENQNLILKPVYNIGKTTVVSIDKTIVETLRLGEGIFLQQEIIENNTGILMRIRNLDDFLKIGPAT